MVVPIQAIRIETQWNGAAISARHWITLHLIDRGARLEIRVSAPYYADPPAPSTPIGPTDRLWEHEVVELFVYGSANQYTEIELSPSGHFLVLQLNGVRQIVKSMLSIEFETTIHEDRWTATAMIDKSLLPPSPLTVNATAIHGSGADRTHLSWVALPGTTPDFHQPKYVRPIAWATADD
jgi:hypothetical protein